MTTVTDAPAPASESSKAEMKECSTRDLLKQIEDAVTAAKLEQDIVTKTVTALEEHLKQLQDYESKITAAGDAYAKGIDAICTGFDDLSAAVEQGKSSYECLLEGDAKTKVVKVLDDLRTRRKTLEACKCELQHAVIDKACELDHATAKVEHADAKLKEMLALLDRRSKELEDLKALKEAIGGCSDTSSNECRYAFYLDLEERLSVECISVDQYRCDLVDQVKALDGERQKLRDADGQARVVQDQLDRVTKLHDDLVAGWKDELCAAVTAGSVAPLPDDLATACPPTETPAPAPGPKTDASAPTGQGPGATQASDQHDAPANAAPTQAGEGAA